VGDGESRKRCDAGFSVIAERAQSMKLALLAQGEDDIEQARR
jgi:hypothetical protein